MKILIVGAHGTLGRAIAANLGARHTLVTAGRNSGDVRMNLRDKATLAAGLAQVGPVDAIISAAGKLAFAPLLEMTEEQWRTGLEDKLMGQVNLALLGVPYLRDGGSITLTTGILSHQPIRTGTSATLVNRAVEGFVFAAATELPRGIRINAVSPGLLSESAVQGAAMFPGFEPVAEARAALAFQRSVEGGETGQTFAVY